MLGVVWQIKLDYTYKTVNREHADSLSLMKKLVIRFKVYRIAGIFRGYKCSRFSRIEPVPRKFIPTKIYIFIE